MSTSSKENCEKLANHKRLFSVAKSKLANLILKHGEKAGRIAKHGEKNPRKLIATSIETFTDYSLITVEAFGESVKVKLPIDKEGAYNGGVRSEEYAESGYDSNRISNVTVVKLFELARLKEEMAIKND